MTRKEGESVQITQAIRVNGLMDYGRTMDIKLDHKYTKAEQAEAVKRLMVQSVMDMDYVLLVEEIHKIQRGERSVFEENVPYTGIH